MTDKEKSYTQIHVFVSREELEKWRAFKQRKYDGLNAMSKMIRDFVNEGIARETKKVK